MPYTASTQLIELLFFAYRDFTARADDRLAAHGFGRAHHRVLHFVSRHPGIRVADLLELLRITKQSLARVLKQLVDEGFVEQRSGSNDRRARHLFVTEKGRELVAALSTLQANQMETALRAAGRDAEDAVRAFLLGLIEEANRSDVREIIARGDGGSGDSSDEAEASGVARTATEPLQTGAQGE